MNFVLIKYKFLNWNNEKVLTKSYNIQFKKTIWNVYIFYQSLTQMKFNNLKVFNYTYNVNNMPNKEVTPQNTQNSNSTKLS